MIINTLIFVLLISIFCFVFMKEKNEIVLYHIGEETNWKYAYKKIPCG